MNTSSVTVVIPVYNAADTIEKVVAAVFSQTHSGHIQLIVVDDGSTDATADIVKAIPDISYIFQQNAGPAAARNAGAKCALGDVIFFTDSDCIPEADWIEKMISYFDAPDVAAVAGSYGIANPQSVLAQSIQNEIEYRHSRLMPTWCRCFGSYNVAIRKEIFDALGGFDTSYSEASGEDNDLSYRILALGKRIRFEPEAKVRHFHTDSVKKYLAEQYRHGYWRIKMYKDHPEMAAGDDYTFLKDIIEIPAAYAIAGFGFKAVFNDSNALQLSCTLIFLMFFLEISFSFLFFRNTRSTLFFSAVMFARSFARAFGFLSGFLSIGLK